MVIPWGELKKVPNVLTLIRFACIPALLVLSYQRLPVPFIAVLGVAGLTDVLDGFLARALHQESDMGANLDGLADEILLTLSVVYIYLFEPGLVMKYALLVGAVIGLCAVKEYLLYFKHRNSMRLHLWSGKTGSVLLYLGIFAFLISRQEVLIPIMVVLALVEVGEEVIILATRERINARIRSVFDRR